MDSSIKLLFILIWSELTTVVVSTAKLTAVSFSNHTQYLYEELKNEGPPLRTDAAISNVRIRARICEDISSSEFFHLLRLIPADISEIIHLDENFLNYSDIFHFNSPTNSQNSHEYTKNPYRQQDISLANSSHPFKEYVFICPFRYNENNDFVIFHVSKEYNVGPFPETFMPGRFVLGRFVGSPRIMSMPFDYAILAEQSATARTEASFNVELHYLRIRKNIQSAENNSLDPLCKLVSEERGPHNRHHRFCVAVSTSSYFEDQIRYPRHRPYPCYKEQIFFRTTDGIQEAAGRSYYERMTRCLSISGNAEISWPMLYISRAYRSNEVLVYRRNSPDEKIYLENLSSNISIIDELNSFDFIED